MEMSPLPFGNEKREEVWEDFNSWEDMLINIL